MKSLLKKSFIGIIIAFSLTLIATSPSYAYHHGTRVVYYGSPVYYSDGYYYRVNHGPSMGYENYYVGPYYYNYPYRCGWIRGYWAYGYYHPAHRVCWR